jgi:acyl-CoA hydrolase
MSAQCTRTGSGRCWCCTTCTILKLLDQAAYACASRYAGRYVVTLSVDQVMFREPIHVGELVSFLASVNHTGTTSTEVGIKVIAENIRTQIRRRRPTGRPAAVPALRPFTPDERRRFAAAQARNDARLYRLASVVESAKRILDRCRVGFQVPAHLREVGDQVARGPHFDVAKDLEEHCAVAGNETLGGLGIEEHGCRCND